MVVITNRIVVTKVVAVTITTVFAITPIIPKTEDKNCLLFLV
jgi:hypothetical protein